MTTTQLADSLTDILALPPGSQAKTERYITELEAGRLNASGLSRRLRDGLGRIFAVSPDLFPNAADAMRPTAPSSVLFRADDTAAEIVQEDLKLLADALAAPPVGEWDQVDALFRGGN
jgi:hypothetical protein